MAKHLKRKEWIKFFKKVEDDAFDWADYLKTRKISGTKQSINKAKCYFWIKYKTWKKDYNGFMKKQQETRGRKRKVDNSDVPKLVKELNREQLEEIAQDWIKEQRKKKAKKKAEKIKKFISLNNLLGSKLLKYHYTTNYKTSKQRKYKFDIYKDIIENEFILSRRRYGRERLSAILFKKYQIDINPRTLGRYINRYGLICPVRRAKRKVEHKKLNVKFKDLVQRIFNPIEDNIVATDVTYIPNVNKYGNHAYLSIAISHKTKLIESWHLSNENNWMLVKDTLKNLKERPNLIVYSDHGKQYSSFEAKQLSQRKKYKISMSRIGNTLDNREAEHFFGTIKSEFLNLINTTNMKLEKLKKLIKNYINWYNNERIQKRLQWKTPSDVSQYAI